MPTRILIPGALDIDNQRVILSVGDTIVGRGSEPGEPHPDIILDPFGAREKGVSRRHIRIKRAEEAVLVTDLGSRNGTWLNGERLTPDTEYPLRVGDKLTLGSLELTAEFDESSPWDPSEPGSG